MNRPTAAELPFAHHVHDNEVVERELCPAFLIEDFEAAAREADAAVKRLCDVASNAAETDLTARPEWEQAQRAIQWQFRARAALEATGLPPSADAQARADRAQADFAALGLRRPSP